MIERARRFFVEDLWRVDFHPKTWMASLLAGLQLAALIARGFVDDKLLLRASALTYITSLAIIPVLVVLLSVIDWLGLSSNLVEMGANQFLAGSPDAVERIMKLVDGANIGAFGSVGGAIFLATTILSLRHVEETFNEIWGAAHSRSWMRRYTNYLAVLVTGPLVLGLLVSLSPDLGADAVKADLHDVPMVDALADVLTGVGPLIFLFISFTLAYFLLPNTPVRLLSASIGGFIAAGLFSVAQYGYVTFSIGAARYDSLFGGFAIVPLLLVWIYVSWSVVLLGAEIAYAHQNLARYRREARDAAMEPAEREAVALRLVVEVARTFRQAEPPQSAQALAVRLGSSLRVVTELLSRYEADGIVTVCGRDGDETYQLGRPAERVTVGQVLSAIRGRRRQLPVALEMEPEIEATVLQVDAVLCDAEVALEPVRSQTLAALLDRQADAAKTRREDSLEDSLED